MTASASGNNSSQLELHTLNEDFTNDNELWAFLYLLAGQKSIEELSPENKSGFGICYRADGVDIPAERLRRLADKGLLQIKSTLSFGSCGHCGSMNLMTVMRCPNCREQALSKSELVVHYDCGHLATVGEITTHNPNAYKCTKCGKEMKRVGIDYGRPGIGFRCMSCKAVSQYPLITIMCDRAHELKIDEEELLAYPIYQLGKALQTMPRIVQHLNTIKDSLARKGVECLVLAQSRGTSGESYVAPLLLLGIPPTIVDFVLDASGWEFQVLQTIKKSADLSCKALLVVRAELFSTVKDMVNPNRIKVLAFDDESAIPETTVSTLLDMRANPSHVSKLDEMQSVLKSQGSNASQMPVR